MFFVQEHPDEFQWEVITVFNDLESGSIARCIPWSGQEKDRPKIEALVRRVLKREELPQENVCEMSNLIFGARFIFYGNSYSTLALALPETGYRFPIIEDGMIKLMKSLNDGHHEHKNGLLEGLFTFQYDEATNEGWILPYNEEHWGDMARDNIKF